MQTPIEKALWFIESHFAGDISLDEVAAVCGLSRFQMSRAFARDVGMSLREYVRARRLSEAARVLAAGVEEVTAVALQAGYGSHEAFTRAFRDRFGVTPVEVRRRGSLDGLALVGPERRDRRDGRDPAPPRIVRAGPLQIAGLAERFRRDDTAGIPALWQRFHPHIGNLAGQRGTTTYGLLTNLFGGGDHYLYLAGVEVSDLSGIPPELTGMRLPAQRYLVFANRGHITTIAGTAGAIWRDWLPKSDYSPGGYPDFMERYGADFDPHTGAGGFEIWIPVRD